MLLGVGLLLLLAHVSEASITFETISHWTGGFEYRVKIPICTDMIGWKVHLSFEDDVDSIEVWRGDAIKVNSTTYVIRNKSFNAVQHVGEILAFDFICHGSGHISPRVEAYLEGCEDYTLAPEPSSTPGVIVNTGGGTSNKDYAEALGKSILFYDAQRSGMLPPNNPIPWRGDSALDDCVVGGWYDAGDHVKFGLPFGATTMLLLWGMDRYKDGYQRTGQLDEAYDMIKWATDYMLNAWNPNTEELVAQIGDGNTDHHYWGRAEDMNMNRPCMKLGPGKPGSDIAGEWAAALAAGYLVFKDKGDTLYANKLLEAAKSLYTFAMTYQGTYNKVVPAGAQFYWSTDYKDEMCEGGVWLYRATKDEQYLSDAKRFHESNTAWALSWDDKKVACQLLLYEETQTSMYKQEVEAFLNDWLPGGGVTYTPCGLAWRDRWGANRYSANTAFVALAAADAGIDTARYRPWAIEQINYLLGDNNHDGGCFSFAIGVGDKYPLNPHHRSASCPDKPAPCSDANLYSPGPSPQLLVGALVGGPDQQGNYKDNRQDYVMNEVAIDYNSGYTSALAGILHLQATDNFPPAHNKCHCDKPMVNATFLPLGTNSTMMKPIDNVTAAGTSTMGSITVQPVHNSTTNSVGVYNSTMPATASETTASNPVGINASATATTILTSVNSTAASVTAQMTIAFPGD